MGTRRWHRGLAVFRHICFPPQCFHLINYKESAHGRNSSMFNCCSPPTLAPPPPAGSSLVQRQQGAPCCWEALLGAAQAARCSGVLVAKPSQAGGLCPHNDRQGPSVHKWAGDLFNLSGDPAAVSNLVWFSWSPSPAAGVQLSTLGQGGFPFSSSETPLEGIQTQSRELGMGRIGEEEWGEKGRRGMKLLGKRSVPSRNQGIWGFVTSWTPLCNKATANNRTIFQALKCSSIVLIISSFKSGSMILTPFDR